MNGKTASILAVGIIIAAFVWGAFFISARNEQSIRVVGQGVKTVTSDIIKWNMSINRTTNVAYKSEGPSWIQEDLIKVKKYLASNGIEEKDILIEPVSSYANYGNNGITGYNFSQRIEVKSDDIEKIEKMALDNKALAKQDIYLEYSNLEYFVSNLAELKAEMLALATADAKARAEEIAKSSGNKICGLLSAKTGVFQIRKPLSMDVSDYGIYNTSSKEKEIAVTVNATFKIK
ncbi:SIMPL domain-containing protein [Candidatus Ruminimicrobiellum ovillum]|uniref:SIMPL domain-containing protein n=1 Tax=Candidatus Ruminimicrobiellum ovillum TaxID=1947927 RepID=UPI003559B083